MSALPDVVLKRLAPIVKATGQSVKQVWETQSKAVRLAAFPEQWRKKWAGLSRDKRAALKGRWSFWGRPAQQIPSLAIAWFIWLILAGRGWGKTATGAQFAIEMARRHPKRRGCLVGATAAEVRDTMVLGDSGIIASSPPDFVPIYEPSKNKLTWPNGAHAICRTADKPNRLRGPNLAWAWCDEVGAWRYPKQAWDMLLYCLRKSKIPRVCVTTTPRPIRLLLDLVKDFKERGSASGIVLTKGSSWDNFWHCSKEWFKRVIARGHGALARQEIWADLAERVVGALWGVELLDELRIINPKHVPQMERVVVAIDPAEEDNPDSDEHGIVAVGRSSFAHGYVLADRSLKAHPAIAARTAYELWLELDADAIVVETNRGGPWITHTIRSVIREGEPRPRIIPVKASKGKATRAEPIAAIYEERRFHHVGTFGELEAEQVSYVPGITRVSPNRMDALVWGATELFKPSFSL